MRVGATKARDHHFAADFLAVLLAHKKKVWGVEHPYAPVAIREAGGNVQPFGKDRDFVGASICIGVLENFDAIAANPRRLARVLDALGDPDAAAIVEIQRDGIDD